MSTELTQKAFEALQVVQSTAHWIPSQALYALSPCFATVFHVLYTCAQAERQSTEFRIKALGKALEYKHLEVSPCFVYIHVLVPFCKPKLWCQQCP